MSTVTATIAKLVTEDGHVRMSVHSRIGQRCEVVPSLERVHWKHSASDSEIVRDCYWVESFESGGHEKFVPAELLELPAGTVVNV